MTTPDSGDQLSAGSSPLAPNESRAPQITRTAFSNSAMRQLAESMVLTNDPISVQRRWGIIDAINPDDTVDIILGGQIVQGIAYDASYQPIVDEMVMLDIVGPDIVVAGTISPSLHTPAHRRATVTAVNATRTSVTLTMDDGTVLTGVAAIAPYIPHTGDEVHALSYQGQYVVIGSRSTTAQVARRAVGDIETSLTVKPGTLALNGQTVSRTTYSQLWVWAQASGLVTAGMFTAGDGTTTFGLPDFRGRVPVGAGTLGSDTYAVGTTGGNARSTLATNQMPAHTHSVSVDVPAHGTHDHSVTASASVAPTHAHYNNFASSSTGSHAHFNNFTSASGGGHAHTGSTSFQDRNATHGHTMQNPRFTNQAHTHQGGANTVPEGPSPNEGVAANIWANNASTDHVHTFTTDSGGGHAHQITGDTGPNGAHSHMVTGDTGSEGDHGHTISVDVVPASAGTHTATVTEATVGGTTAVDLRQPYLGIQMIIWT